MMSAIECKSTSYAARQDKCWAASFPNSAVQEVSDFEHSAGAKKFAFRVHEADHRSGKHNVVVIERCAVAFKLVASKAVPLLCDRWTLGKVLPVSFWHRGSCTCKISGRLSALVVIRDGAKTQCQCLYHQYIAQIRSAFLSLRLQVQLCLNEPATQHDS